MSDIVFVDKAMCLDYFITQAPIIILNPRLGKKGSLAKYYFVTIELDENVIQGRVPEGHSKRPLYGGILLSSN